MTSISQKASFNFKEGKLEEINAHVDKIKHVVAIVSSYPTSASLSQKKPFVGNSHIVEQIQNQKLIMLLTILENR